MFLIDRSTIYLLAATAVALIWGLAALKYKHRENAWSFLYLALILAIASGAISTYQAEQKAFARQKHAELAGATQALRQAGRRQGFKVVAVNIDNLTAIVSLKSGCEPQVFLVQSGEDWAFSPPDPTENCPPPAKTQP